VGGDMTVIKKKATDSLLNDHKMIRKLLDEWRLDNPRFREISKTVQRVVLTHAWFEDTVFLPAFKGEPLLLKRYLNEIYEEHKDIDYLLKLVMQMGNEKKSELDAYLKQFKAVLKSHLGKEEDALFPLAEKILDEEGLNRLGDEMRLRQLEAQKLFAFE
jgi:hemerythrin-like domain-containing protein